MPDPFEAAYDRLLATSLARGLRARLARPAPAEDGLADLPPSRRSPPSRLLQRLTLMSPKLRPHRSRGEPD